MSYAHLLAAALALFCSGCGGFSAAYRHPAPRDLSRARRVLIVPFSHGARYYAHFFDLASSELWPGRVVPREEAERALVRAGYAGRETFPPRAAAVSAAEATGADIVLSGYLDFRGVLRLRALGVPGGAQWFRDGRVASYSDLQAFVAAIRADLEASRARLVDPPPQERRYSPTRRPKPGSGTGNGGGPVRADGSAGPAPAEAPAPAATEQAGEARQADEAQWGDGAAGGGPENAGGAAGR